jgi:hypothetical protein
LTITTLLASSASGWDEEGHVIVTHLAVTTLPRSMPDWLRDPAVQSRLKYLSAEPDRWRGQHSDVLDHINNPDHYVDEELLHPYGLSIKTLPLFRREFTDVLATQRALHPEKFKPEDREEDRAYTRLVPGLLPYRIAELEWTIAAGWTTLKTYEEHRDLVTDDMIRSARENIIHDMGLLSHFVGDGCQPLHTTHHHHGWVGPNPKGYTREHGFHEYIDRGVIVRHHLTPESLAALAKPPKKIPADGWSAICEYLDQTYQQVEPLYALEQSGELNKEAGKKFIEDRLLDGGAMLAGIWVAAYQASHVDEFREEQLLGRPRRSPQSRPTSQPAGKGKPAEKQ